MLPIETYIVGYINPETKEVHLVLTKATNQVLAINQARIQFPANFQFCLLERLGMKLFKVTVYDEGTETAKEIEVKSNDIYDAKEKARLINTKRLKLENQVRYMEKIYNEQTILSVELLK